MAPGRPRPRDAPAQGHLLRTVGTHDQDTAALQAPSQVHQQVDGSRIGPLHVVQRKQQGPRTRHSS